MNLQKPIKQILSEALKNPFLNDDAGWERYLLELIYERNKENTMNLFLRISELDKKRLREEKMVLYHGLENGMHSFVHLSRLLMEEKTSRQAKDMLKHVFEGSDLTYILPICKAYFPDAKLHNASNNGRWFLNKFRDLVQRNKADFEEGGKSYDWAKINKHLDYIKLVLENINEE